MPPAQAPDLAGKTISRKSHRKSRHGCSNCKGRRIKCDEQKPRCSNCMKYADICIFSQPSRPSPASSTQSYGLSQPGLDCGTASPDVTAYTPCPLSEASFLTGNPHPLLNIVDLELLHHYNTSTSYTMANVSGLQIFMRVTLPQIGFSHPFVLHSILALSALHLSHYKMADSKSHYLSQAQYHYEAGLRIATLLLPDINQDTCPPLYIFTTICYLFTLGVGPKPGDFLIFSDSGIAEWLLLFQGMKSILESNYDILCRSELAPLFQISSSIVNSSTANDEHLKELVEIITMTSSKDPDFQVYITAVENLSKSFPASPSPGKRERASCPQQVFVWLFRLSEQYVACLQQRKPVAMVILAYFCVLLNDLSSSWWIKGWAEHLISEIYASLTAEHRLWIRWPMEETGWIPA